MTEPTEVPAQAVTKMIAIMVSDGQMKYTVQGISPLEAIAYLEIAKGLIGEGLRNDNKDKEHKPE